MDEYACRRRIGLLAALSEMPAGLSQWVRYANDALSVPVLPTDALGPAIDTIFDWGHRIGLLVTVVSGGREAMRLAWLRVESPIAADPARGRGQPASATTPVGEVLHVLSPDRLSTLQVEGRHVRLKPVLASSCVTDEEAVASIAELVSPLGS